MAEDSSDERQAPKVGGRYAHYVLFVLVIVYVFNFIDRNILSILSQEIQEWQLLHLNTRVVQLTKHS